MQRLYSRHCEFENHTEKPSHNIAPSEDIRLGYTMETLSVDHYNCM